MGDGATADRRHPAAQAREMGKQPFVNRAAELSVLKDGLQATLDGRTRVAFVTGGAGSGKTALVREFVRRAQARAPDVSAAFGSCTAQAGFGDPYLPFREILASLIGTAAPHVGGGAAAGLAHQRVRTLFVRSAQVLIDVGPSLIGALVPGAQLAAVVGKAVAEQSGLLDRLDEIAVPADPTSPEPMAAAQRTRLHEHYADFLATLSDEHPIIAVLDDLQWADAPSVGLLFHLARTLQQARVLILGCYRSADVAVGRRGARHPLGSMVHEVQRYGHGTVIDLDATPPAKQREFMEALLDSQANNFEVAFRNSLFERTEGHPLFTLELLANLRARGVLARNDEGVWVAPRDLEWGGIPDRVEAVLGERLDRLDGELRQLLTVAAVAGDPFSAEVVATVLDMPPRSVVHQLAETLGRQHSLVEPVGMERIARERLSRFAFRHSLVRQHVYQATSEAERAYLHEDVARAIEALYEADLDRFVAQLAYHYDAAGLPEEASDYYRRAGLRALALFAPRTAVELLTQSLERAVAHSPTVTPETFMARGRAHQTLGDFDASRSDYETALDLARRPPESLEWQWRSLVALGMLWASRDYTRTGDLYRQALRVARTTTGSLPVARSLNAMGNWHVNIEQPQQAIAYHQEALAIFERESHRQGIAQTLDLLGLASALGGDLAQSVDYYEQAIGRFRELGDRRGLASSLASSMSAWDQMASTLVPPSPDGDRCIEQGEEALEIARAMEWSSGEAYARISLSFCLGPMGEYGAALAHARSALRVATEISHRQWQVAATVAVAAVLAGIMAEAQAAEELRIALDGARAIGSRFWEHAAAGLLISVLAGLGETAMARAVLDALDLGLAEGTSVHTLAGRLVLCAKADLALAQDDAAHALAIVDALIGSARARSTDGVVPRLSHLRGMALLALDRPRDAQAELRAGAEAAHAYRMPPLEWRLRSGLARAQRQLGDDVGAARQAKAAEEIVKGLARSIPDAILREQLLSRAAMQI